MSPSELYDFILLKRGILNAQLNKISEESEESNDYTNEQSIRMFYMTTLTYLYGLEMMITHGAADKSLQTLMSFWLKGSYSTEDVTGKEDEAPSVEEEAPSVEAIITSIKYTLKYVLLPYWIRVKNTNPNSQVYQVFLNKSGDNWNDGYLSFINKS